MFAKISVQSILWFGVFVSPFYLAGAPEVIVSGDQDNTNIPHHKRDSYRTNVLHVRELNFLLLRLNLMLQRIDANYFKDIFI